MRFLFNGEIYMSANDGTDPTKLSKALNNLIENHGVIIRSEGFCDGSHSALYLPGHKPDGFPDFQNFDYDGSKPPLDETLDKIYKKLGLDTPDLKSATPSFKLRG
jgi:hypothetical protein